MKNLLFAIGLTSFLLTFSACNPKAKTEVDAETPEETTKVTADKYCNEKYGFCISYPDGAFVLKEEESNNEGAVLVSPDGLARLVVHAGNLSGKITGGINELQKAHAEDIKQIGKREVTLNTLKPSYYVLNGYENKTIFYQKTILAKGQLATAVLYYDNSVKDIYYPMLVSMFKSFE